MLVLNVKDLQRIVQCVRNTLKNCSDLFAEPVSNFVPQFLLLLYSNLSSETAGSQFLTQMP